LNVSTGSSAEGPAAFPLSERMGRLTAANRAFALVTVVDGPVIGAKMLLTDEERWGSLGAAGIDARVARDARADLAVGWTGLRYYGRNGEPTETDITLMVDSHRAPPSMLIFGAVDFSVALAEVAKLLGYDVSVCDPRSAFATAKRFPMADRIHNIWPDKVFGQLPEPLGPRDAVCVLTHDSKLDIPAIRHALATDAGYIGVMGSRRTHADRTERLLEAGVSETDLERLMSPIGLDIGARTPAETAISIMAEIIANDTGRSVPRLRDTDGPIH